MIVLDKENVVRTAHTLAQRYQISYEPSTTDVLAENLTRLCGDEVPELDETQLSLIAPRRAGHINGSEFMALQAAYLQQKSK